MHNELMVKPTDSDQRAQLKIAVMWMLLGAMVLGPLAEYLPDITSDRAYNLAGMTGFTIGLYIDRTWWTGS